MRPALVRQVVRHKTDGESRDSLVAELRAELVRKIASHTRGVGERTTAIPGLTLYRRTDTTACYPATYEPSFNVFVQGRKRVTFGATTYLCDESTLLLKFDMTLVRGILTQEEFQEHDGRSQGRGIAIGKTTADLLQPCSRLLDLLGAPEDIPFMSKLIQREIVYRLLRGPQGARLR